MLDQTVQTPEDVSTGLEGDSEEGGTLAMDLVTGLEWHSTAEDLGAGSSKTNLCTATISSTILD